MLPFVVLRFLPVSFVHWYIFLHRHAQAIASVKAFSHWLAQYYNESQRVEAEKEKFATILSSLLESLMPLFTTKVSE